MFTNCSVQMNLEPGQEVFEVMIAANKVGLVIGMSMSVLPQDTCRLLIRNNAMYL